ncbi:DUF4232 domain-containing protein [Streptomyces sp. NPDC041068]|uniref:DUF4232 domain-containing protein n=1 Tax=Streptomyces sp. NPDC041068 TaxID=3155130 RepID=UPI00340D6AE4
MSHNRSRTALAIRTGAAAAVALGALSLTACSDGLGTRDEGAATLVASSIDQQNTAGQAAAKRLTADDRAAKSARSAKATGTAEATSAKAAAPVTCSSTNTKVKVTKVSRPVNHLLVTATNTGTKPCFAYNAPFLRFDDAQAPVAVNRDSVPQSVVTLEPGQSAYAGITTSAADGSGQDGYTAERLGVLFSNRAMNGSVGSEVSPALPAGGVYVDSAASTTYWQQTREDALSW